MTQVKLTAAQALVRYLAAQMVEVEDAGFPELPGRSAPATRIDRSNMAPLSALGRGVVRADPNRAAAIRFGAPRRGRYRSPVERPGTPPAKTLRSTRQPKR